MYVVPNYKTKTALKKDLAAGVKVRVVSPGPFPAPSNGKATIEGPHYPQPHTWYAQCLVKDGFIVPGSVK